MTGASFIGVAIAIWRKPDVRAPKAKDSAVLQGAAVAFAAIFFSEWGDVGQVTAAGMSAKYVWSARAGTTTASLWQTALAVWLGAVAAMVTKGTLASVLGAGVRAVDRRARPAARRALRRHRCASRPRRALGARDARRSCRLTAREHTAWT